MGEEVGARARAEESEQGETRRDDHPPLARGWAASAGHDSRGGEDSDGAEHCRRGAHGVVVGTVGEGGEGVAAGAGEEEHAEAHTGAELMTHRPYKHDARPGVADHVGCVGVER